MSDTKPLDVTQQVTQALSDERDIPGFPGYTIDIQCRVWSYKRKCKRLKAATADKDGYLRCSLMRPESKTMKAIGIHRIMLLAFKYIEGCELLTVDHINGVKDDNRLENLRWLTRDENSSKMPNRAFGERIGCAKLDEHKVRFIRKAFGVTHNSPQLAELLGVSQSSIIKAKNGTLWKHVI